MHIVSIDSGLEKVGFAVFEKGKFAQKLITSGVYKTHKKHKLETRLKYIYIEIQKLIKLYKPDRIVIERLFFFKNQKTAIGVSQSQGVILLAGAQNNIPVTFLTPLQIKQIVTGYGQSDKESVKKMVKLQLHVELQTKEDDETDAIAAGLAYCYINEKLL